MNSRERDQMINAKNCAEARLAAKQILRERLNQRLEELQAKISELEEEENLLKEMILAI